MPTRHEVATRILGLKNSSQDDVRREYLQELSKYTERDTILYSAAFTPPKFNGLPISISNEDIQGFMSALHGLKGEKLDLILHSPGGSLEAAEQIVSYLRCKYSHIRAIIPQNAMSAATMIACACDEIVMGKHSAIGPIDPQITFPAKNGLFTSPAQSILDEFEQAKAEVIENPKTAMLWVHKLQDFPPGFLDICKNTLKLAEEKVKEWLFRYMYKKEIKYKETATKIASFLSDARKHKTHGRPICINTCKEVGLKVTELEEDQDLQEKVLSVFHATMVTFDTTGCIKIIENQNGKGWYSNIR